MTALASGLGALHGWLAVRVHRQRSAPARSTPSGEPDAAARPPWLIDRDLDAVALPLDSWILVAEPDHDARTTSTPLLGTPEWVAADEEARNATFALYVIACLAEREPVVIAARLAAEIAAERSAYLVVALRQGSQTISEGHVLPPPAEALPMDRHVRRGTSWNRPDRARTASFCGGSVRQHAAKPSGGLVRLVRPLEVAAGRDRAP